MLPLFFSVEAQIVVKPNLNTVVGDTTKFTQGSDEGRLGVEAYDKQIGLSIKSIVSQNTVGDNFLYGFYNYHRSYDLPNFATNWVRAGIHTFMETKQGNFVNAIFNYVTEKSGTQTSQTTGIINKLDSIRNQLNGFYNSVRYSGSGDIRFVRNFIDQTTQTLPFGDIYGVYNDFEMAGNKNNYGVYNALKLNNNYSPSYATTGIKNFIKISSTANAANLVGVVRTIGLDNDIELYGNVNNYGIYNILKMTQAYTGTTFGIRTEITHAAGVDTATAFSPNFRYGVFSDVKSSYGAGGLQNGYAGYFVGSVVINGSFQQTSDIKLKENIEDFTGALSIIKRIIPKKYNLRAEGNNSNRKKHIGFIAQDMETVMPDLVSDVVQPSKMKLEESIVEVTKHEIERDNRGNPVVKVTKVNEKQEKRVEGLPETMKAINYSELIPVLLQAIKEQQAIIEQLQTDVEALKRRN